MGRTSETRVYGIWEHMIQRCENPNDRNYKNYGARGISVCQDWHKSKSFIAWAYGNGYSDNLTLDRIDNDGNYCPENCRWADLNTQRNNTSRNHYIEVAGERLTLKQASEKYEINYMTLKTRISRGVDHNRAVRKEALL